MSKPNIQTTKFALALGVAIISLAGLTTEGAAAVASGLLTVSSSDASVFTVETQPDGLYQLTFVGAGHSQLLVSYAGDNETPAFDQAISIFVVDEAVAIDHFDVTVVSEGPTPTPTATATGASGADATIGTQTATAATGPTGGTGAVEQSA